VHEFDRETAIQILRKTPDTLRELLDGVSFEAFQHKSSDKAWTPRQILIHLIDVEFAYGFRFRYIMAEKNPQITPFDQDLWASTFQYGDQDATQLIRAFTPLRRVNVELLQTVDTALLEKPAHHPQFGTITVSQMIPHLAGHDLNHLEQIRERLPAI
jgi:hypothetical protein